MNILKTLFGRATPKPIAPTKTEAPSKVCGTCKKLLPLTSYSKNRDSKDGLQTECKRCKSKYMRGYWQRKKTEVAKAKIAVDHANISIHMIPRKEVEFLAKLAADRKIKKNDLYLEVIQQYVFLAKK
jgi:hypothetical protein